jgi:hypothetical protein
MEGMTDGCNIPERIDIEDVRHEYQAPATTGIPGMELLYRTAVPLPYVRLLLVGKVFSSLPVPGVDRAG